MWTERLQNPEFLPSHVSRKERKKQTKERKEENATDQKPGEIRFRMIRITQFWWTCWEKCLRSLLSWGNHTL